MVKELFDVLQKEIKDKQTGKGNNRQTSIAPARLEKCNQIRSKTANNNKRTEYIEVISLE